jgi:hypothetical protein
MFVGGHGKIAPASSNTSTVPSYRFFTIHGLAYSARCIGSKPAFFSATFHPSSVSGPNSS